MRRTVTAALALLIVVAACGSDDDEDYTGPFRALTTDPQSGIATFYDADGSGNCSFPKTPNDLDVTALAMDEYDRSASCGGCLRVSGPDGEVTVRVVDSCPPCLKRGVNLDLSASAFAKIADPDRGRIPIKYRLVPCAVTGNIAFFFKDGSSKDWTAIQIRNHKLPVAKLEYDRSGSWIAMNRENYDYFVEPQGVGDQPKGLRLRVTANDGQVIEETLAGGIPSNKGVTGTHQFE